MPQKLTLMATKKVAIFYNYSLLLKNEKINIK